jgi:peptidoglycan hydrolase CwlO-like protein
MIPCAGLQDDIPAERILDNARREYENNRQIATVSAVFWLLLRNDGKCISRVLVPLCVQEMLPSTLQQRAETLQHLQRSLMEPAKSDQEINALKSELARTQAEVDRLQTEIAEANRKQGDDKLALYRSQYALLAKKLQQQETEVERARQENDKLGRELQSKEARLSEISGPRFMKRDEFRNFAAQVRTKTNTFKTMKAELTALRQELVVLSRTENVRGWVLGAEDCVRTQASCVVVRFCLTRF